MRIFVAAAVVAFAVPYEVSLPQTCLHGPSEPSAQKSRRHLALTVAHQINRAQTLARQQTGRYRSLAELPRVAMLPAGFDLQLQTDGASYTFSVKDRQDPCAYAIFSDDAGRVYEGYPSTGAAVWPALSS
jgi:hypothetical protein